jgi:hypothetical protein
MPPLPSRVAAWAVGAAIVAVVTGAVLRARSPSRRALAEARPGLERFLAALDAGSADDLAAAAHPAFAAAAPAARLAPVLASLAGVLGPSVEREEPEARLSARDRLELTLPVRHERGRATYEIAAAKGEDGRWRVTACAARTAAFAWVLAP